MSPDTRQALESVGSEVESLKKRVAELEAKIKKLEAAIRDHLSGSSHYQK